MAHHNPYEISDMTKFHELDMSIDEKNKYEKLMVKTVHDLKLLASNLGLEPQTYTEKDELVKAIMAAQKNTA